MIPVLFEHDTDNFYNNGLGLLSHVLKAEATEEKNGILELELEYPLLGPLANALIEHRIILAKYSDDEESLHAFRINEIEKSLEEGKIIVHASSRTNDLANSVVTNMGEMASSPTVVLQAMMNHSIDWPSYPLTLTTDLIAGKNSIDLRKFRYKNVLDCIAGNDSSFINVFGGEIKRENNKIKILAQRGFDRNTVLRPGKNLDGVKLTIDTRGIVTRILPWFKFTGEDKNEYYVEGDLVNSSRVNDYPIKFTQSVDCSSLQVLDTAKNENRNIRSKEELMSHNDVRNWFLNHPGIDIPKVSAEVDIRQYSDSVSISDQTLLDLERLQLCDYIYIYVPQLNMDVKMQVTKVVYDCILEKVVTINAGSNRGSLYDKVMGDVTKTDDLRNQMRGLESDLRNTIMTSANGKNTVHFGTTFPPGTNHKVGDLFWHQENSETTSLYIWDGETWKVQLQGDLKKTIAEDYDAKIKAVKKIFDDAEAAQVENRKTIETSITETSKELTDLKKTMGDKIKDIVNPLITAGNIYNSIINDSSTHLLLKSLISNEALTATKNKFNTIDTNLSGMVTSISRIAGDVGAVNTTITTEVGKVKTEISNVKTSISGLSTNFTTLNSTVSQIPGKITTELSKVEGKILPAATKAVNDSKAYTDGKVVDLTKKIGAIDSSVTTKITTEVGKVKTEIEKIITTKEGTLSSAISKLTQQIGEIKSTVGSNDGIREKITSVLQTDSSIITSILSGNAHPNIIKNPTTLEDVKAIDGPNFITAINKDTADGVTRLSVDFPRNNRTGTIDVGYRFLLTENIKPNAKYRLKYHMVVEPLATPAPPPPPNQGGNLLQGTDSGSKTFTITGGYSGYIDTSTGSSKIFTVTKKPSAYSWETVTATIIFDTVNPLPVNTDLLMNIDATGNHSQVVKAVGIYYSGGRHGRHENEEVIWESETIDEISSHYMKFRVKNPITKIEIILANVRETTSLKNICLVRSDSGVKPSPWRSTGPIPTNTGETITDDDYEVWLLKQGAWSKKLTSRSDAGSTTERTIELIGSDIFIDSQPNYLYLQGHVNKRIKVWGFELKELGDNSPLGRLIEEKTANYWSLKHLNSADDVVTQINTSSDGVRIKGKNIALDGDVTVTGTSWLDGAIIKNASISGAQIGQAAIQSAQIAALDAAKITGLQAQVKKVVTSELISEVITTGELNIGTNAKLSIKNNALKINYGNNTTDRLSIGVNGRIEGPTRIAGQVTSKMYTPVMTNSYESEGVPSNDVYTVYGVRWLGVVHHRPTDEYYLYIDDGSYPTSKHLFYVNIIPQSAQQIDINNYGIK